MRIKQYAQVDRPITALINIGRHGKPEFITISTRSNSHGTQSRQTVTLKQHCILQSNINLLTFPRLIPMTQRSQCPKRPMKTTKIISEECACLGRWTVGRAIY